MHVRNDFRFHKLIFRHQKCRHKYKFKTIALREIRRQQKLIDLIIFKRILSRFFREIVHDINFDFRV
jgi:hypothetical protein